MLSLFYAQPWSALQSATSATAPMHDPLLNGVWHMPVGWELPIWIAGTLVILLLGLTVSAWYNRPELMIPAGGLAMLWPLGLLVVLPLAVLGYPLWRSGRWYWSWIRRLHHERRDVPRLVAERLRAAHDPAHDPAHAPARDRQ